MAVKSKEDEQGAPENSEGTGITDEQGAPENSGGVETLSSKTLKTDYPLFDATTGTKYQPGHVFEGEIPLFILAQVEFGSAQLV